MQEDTRGTLHFSRGGVAFWAPVHRRCPGIVPLTPVVQLSCMQEEPKQDWDLLKTEPSWTSHELANLLSEGLHGPVGSPSSDVQGNF